MSIKMEVWGDYACFTRPEMKVERVSYDVPTPSAARGMVESVYFHNGLRWIIDRIYVCNPIRFINIRRNEVPFKVSRDKILREANGRARSYINRKEKTQQRATMMLRDVHYVIEAHFVMTDQANPSDNPVKFQDHKILKKFHVTDFQLFHLSASIQNHVFKIQETLRICCREYFYFSPHAMSGGNYSNL